MEALVKDWMAPERLYQRLMEERNLASRPHFSPHPSRAAKVHLKPDESVSPAKFRLDPLRPDTYRAHPLTISAVREDIFFQGQDEFSILKLDYQCHHCQNEMDLQFWRHCPYCGTDISR